MKSTPSQPILVFFSLICVSCAAVTKPPQVLKTVGKVDAAVNLAIVGPANWEQIRDSNERGKATRLAYVEAKTGRILRDLSKDLPTGFLYQGSWAEATVAPSPDHRYVAVTVTERRWYEVKLFENDGHTFPAVASFRQPDTEETMEKVFHVHFGTTQNGTGGASWKGNSEVSVSFESQHATDIDPNVGAYRTENVVTHPFEFEFTYRLDRGQAELVGAKGVLDGVTKHIPKEDVVWPRR